MSMIGLAARGAILAFALGAATSATASPFHQRHHGPAVFHGNKASAIGRARQHYDRAQYDRYRGNPGAQFELRQNRQNLCRNVPEMC